MSQDENPIMQIPDIWHKTIEITGNYQLVDNDSGCHYYIKSPAIAPPSPVNYIINLPPTGKIRQGMNFKFITENMVLPNVNWFIVSDQHNLKGFICHFDGCEISMNSSNTQRHNTIKIPPLTQEGQSVYINGYNGYWYIDSGALAGRITFGPT